VKFNLISDRNEVVNTGCKGIWEEGSVLNKAVILTDPDYEALRSEMQVQNEALKPVGENGYILIVIFFIEGCVNVFVASRDQRVVAVPTR